MNTTLRLAAALALSALVLTLPACKKARDAAVNAALERATGAKVERNGDEVTIATEQGTLRATTDDGSGSIALPASFPKDIQLPGAYKVASVMELGGSQVVTLKTPEATAALFNAISSGMEGKGWKRELAAQTGDGGTLGFSKDNLRVVYYIAKNEAGGSDLNINVSTETEG